MRVCLCCRDAAGCCKDLPTTRALPHGLTPMESLLACNTIHLRSLAPLKQNLLWQPTLQVWLLFKPSNVVICLRSYLESVYLETGNKTFFFESLCVAVSLT